MTNLLEDADGLLFEDILRFAFFEHVFLAGRWLKENKCFIVKNQYYLQPCSRPLHLLFCRLFFLLLRIFYPVMFDCGLPFLRQHIGNCLYARRSFLVPLNQSVSQQAGSIYRESPLKDCRPHLRHSMHLSEILRKVSCYVLVMF